MTEHEMVGNIRDHRYELTGAIRRSLMSIRDNYEAALEPAKRGHGGSTVKASKEPPMPISAHILDVRLDTFHDLHYWCSFILENMRGANGAALATHVELTIDGMTAFVNTWADRIVTDFPDDGQNLGKEVAKHARNLSGIVQETGVRKFPIGGCPEHGTSDMGERIPCPGELRAMLRKDDDLLPSEVACSVDEEHRWAAREWMQLGRRIVTEMTA